MLWRFKDDSLRGACPPIWHWRSLVETAESKDSHPRDHPADCARMEEAAASFVLPGYSREDLASLALDCDQLVADVQPLYEYSSSAMINHDAWVTIKQIAGNMVQALSRVRSWHTDPEYRATHDIWGGSDILRGRLRRRINKPEDQDRDYLSDVLLRWAIRLYKLERGGTGEFELISFPPAHYIEQEEQEGEKEGGGSTAQAKGGKTWDEQIHDRARFHRPRNIRADRTRLIEGSGFFQKLGYVREEAMTLAKVSVAVEHLSSRYSRTEEYNRRFCQHHRTMPPVTFSLIFSTVVEEIQQHFGLIEKKSDHFPQLLAGACSADWTNSRGGTQALPMIAKRLRQSAYSVAVDLDNIVLLRSTIHYLLHHYRGISRFYDARPLNLSRPVEGFELGPFFHMCDEDLPDLSVCRHWLDNSTSLLGPQQGQLYAEKAVDAFFNRHSNGDGDEQPPGDQDQQQLRQPPQLDITNHSQLGAAIRKLRGEPSPDQEGLLGPLGQTNDDASPSFDILNIKRQGSEAAVRHLIKQWLPKRHTWYATSIPIRVEHIDAQFRKLEALALDDWWKLIW